MPNPYVNKVVQSNGTTLIDISDTTAVAADVASGKYFYTASGEKVEGTASGGEEPSGPTYVNIVPEQTFTPTSDYTLLTSTEALVAEEKYRYIVNGVEKTGTAAEFYGSIVLGNYSDYSSGTGGAFESLNGVIYYDTKLRTAQTVQVDRVVEGSGGASNIVTGTFKGTTTGAAMDVNLDYSGNGYPIAVLIFPEEGTANPDGDYYPTLLRGAVMLYSVIKNVSTTAPTYTGGTNDDTTYAYRNKSSTTNASTTGAGGGVSAKLYNDTAAASGLSSLVKIRSNKKLSVYILSSSGSSNGGFMANIDYRYIVYYSS